MNYEKSQIGNGTFYTGDCFDVMNDISDNSIDMVLCDLPYGTTACKWDTVLPFDKLWEQYWRISKLDTAIILTASQPFTTALIYSQLSNFKYELIWSKPKGSNYVHANFQPLKTHENICVFSRGGSAQGSKKPMKYFPVKEHGKPYNKGYGKAISSTNTGGSKIPFMLENASGDRFPTSITKFNIVNRNKIHPTQKPVDLFEYLIKTYSNEGDLILDNCAGSGTLAIACENTNRRWICIEKEQEYADKAIERITNHIIEMK